MTLNLANQQAAIFSEHGHFTVRATFWPGQEGESDAWGFFGQGYIAALEGSFGQGFDTHVSATEVSFTCLASAAADVWADGEETPLTITADPGLGVEGGNYILKEKQPSGPGLVLLLLEDAP